MRFNMYILFSRILLTVFTTVAISANTAAMNEQNPGKDSQGSPLLNKEPQEEQKKIDAHKMLLLKQGLQDRKMPEELHGEIRNKFIQLGPNQFSCPNGEQLRSLLPPGDIRPGSKYTIEFEKIKFNVIVNAPEFNKLSVEVARNSKKQIKGIWCKYNRKNAIYSDVIAEVDFEGMKIEPKLVTFNEDDIVEGSKPQKFTNKVDVEPNTLFTITK
jgi:hypothetical protein